MVSNIGYSQVGLKAGGSYLFHTLLGDISDHCHLPSLSHSVCAANRLFLDRRVPLGLDKVHSISYGQREATTALASARLVPERLRPRPCHQVGGGGDYPTEPVWIDISKTCTEGSCLNLSRRSSRSDVPTRPSICRHRMPLPSRILCSESRVLSHDVKMRLPQLYQSAECTLSLICTSLCETHLLPSCLCCSMLSATAFNLDDVTGGKPLEGELPDSGEGDRDGLAVIADARTRCDGVGEL